MSGSGGQPKIQDWERVRVMAWTDLVRRLTQAEMDKHRAGRLQADSRFYPSALSVANRWNAPQRKTQFPNTVTMTDLGSIFLGERGGEETRTDFSAYSKGRNARPKLNVLELVEECLPGTLPYYQIGPYGLPIWQALEGSSSNDQFWHFLITSDASRAKEWTGYVSFMKNLGLEEDARNKLTKLGWTEWVDVLAGLQNIRDASALDQMRLALITAMVLSRACASPEEVDLLAKERLMGVVPRFAYVWPLFDSRHLLKEQPEPKNDSVSVVDQHIQAQQGKLLKQVEKARESGLI